MRELVEEWNSEGVPGVVDAETKAKLEALGYAGTAPSQSTDIDPKDKIHLIHDFFTALSSYRAGDFADASERLDGILEEDSKLLDALFLRGVLAMKEGETAVALRVFEDALALKPDHVMVVFNQTLLYRQLGRLEEAIPAFERAIELDPSQVKAAFNLAQILQERGDADRALLYYQKQSTFTRSGLRQALIDKASPRFMTASASSTSERATFRGRRARSDGRSSLLPI